MGVEERYNAAVRRSLKSGRPARVSAGYYVLVVAQRTWELSYNPEVIGPAKWVGYSGRDSTDPYNTMRELVDNVIGE